MPDTLGQQDLNGIFIEKVLKGFADEDFVFKDFLTVTPTTNRQIRWWQKTAGVLSGTKTSGITADGIVGVAFGTLPPIQEQSATQINSYVKQFAVISPWFTYADIKDSDPDMLAANVRDLRRAVENQMDYRILDVLSGTTFLSGTAAGAGTGWNDTTAGNPFLDLLSGSTEIRKQGYDISNTVAWVHPTNYKALMNYFVTVKGSSVPQFASANVADGVLTKIANVRIVVSNNCTAGQVMMITPQRTATWKEFQPITGETEENKAIQATRVIVHSAGEVLHTDPKSSYLIKGVGV